MKKRFLLPLTLLALSFLNSCTTQMYVSNTVNAPLLKERGEVQLTATPNDLQAAVGVGRHVGLMVNGYYKNYTGSNNYRHDGVLGEAGVGYFTPLAENFVFETYVGAGAGRVHKQEEFTGPADNTYLASFDAKASKMFIQPDFGYKSRFVDVVISSRFSFVKYNAFTQSNYPQNELREDYLENNRITGPLFVFAEPALTLRGGYKFIKVQFQYGLTINATSERIKHPYNFSSVGVLIDIAKWYNR
ncbi:MAG: hypothetical protein JNL60_19240 [Bacteroidia bacterium]|nr:hypothetical protein [Bacteroidia bacterium]